MRQSELVDSQHGLASVLRGTLLVGKLFLYYLYIVLPRKITKSLLIRKLLVLHNEVDRRAALAAAEAFAYVSGAVY